MADKKLSDFSYVQQSDVSDLIVLFLDENNAPKNGRLNFQTFVSGLALLGSSNTFVGANTFSGNVVFSGNATFNNTINANISGSSATATTATTAASATNATNATNDGIGNNIANTYAKKDASNFTQAGKDAIIELGMPDYSRSVSASTTVGQVQSVLVDSEIRVIQSGSGNSYYMYYNIVPCDSDGTEIIGYCLTGSGGYTGAVSGNSMMLKKGSYFKVKSWSAMTNDNSILITPLFGG